jgi:hypothetical protein
LHVFQPVHECKHVFSRYARKLRQEVHDGGVVLLAVELVGGVDRNSGSLGRVGLFAAFLEFFEKFTSGVRTEISRNILINPILYRGRANKLFKHFITLGKVST